MRAIACLLAGGLALSLGPAVVTTGAQQGQPPAGFTSIFNGKDLSGWKIPEGDGGHWKVLAAGACDAAVPSEAAKTMNSGPCIDYDASSQAKDKNLWTVKSYRNFELTQAQRDVVLQRNAELNAVIAYNQSLVDFQLVQVAPLGGF